ncbi:MAG: PadR family transcriptional regulator [Candidatus Bathyarchaeia archaeon]|nr:PadR family transcriptional regulator [Candidatus Bathyarchaeota archaeon]
MYSRPLPTPYLNAGYTRIFERGDLRFLILLLLRKRSNHGYGLMKAISEEFQYTPSPGVLYPTLQMLEDMGYVKANQENNRKVYSITDEGIKYLEENYDIVRRIETTHTYIDKFILRKDIIETNRLLLMNYPYLSQKKMEKIHDTIREMNRRIREIIFE